MVNEQVADPSRLDAVFAALAHPIRRAIIERLAAGEATVSQLAAPHDVTAPAITKHLRVLEEAGLLIVRPDGRVRRCNLDARPLGTAFGWLTRHRVFWEDRLDALTALLEDDDTDSESPTAPDDDIAAARAEPDPRPPSKPEREK